MIWKLICGVVAGLAFLSMGTSLAHGQTELAAWQGSSGIWTLVALAHGIGK